MGNLKPQTVKNFFTYYLLLITYHLFLILVFVFPVGLSWAEESWVREPAFAGLSYDAIGLRGVLVNGVVAGAST